MKRNIVVIACMLLVLSGCAGFRAEVWMPAEMPLPTVTERLETPEFWIERMTDPDVVLMTASEIEAFNRRALELGVYLTDVFSLPETESKEDVQGMIAPLFEWAENGGFIGHDNFPLTPEFFAGMKGLTALGELPETVTVAWGMTVRETDVRVLPTKELALEEKNDYQFDYFQMSRLSWGTPVAVIWESADGSWSFIVSPYVSGWVASEDIGIAKGRDVVMDYAASDSFIVATGPMVSVFSGDASRPGGDAGAYLGGLRLGSRVLLVTDTEGAWKVRVPVREADGSLAFAPGFIEKGATISVGYLDYTQRNVITVAFSMLDERYGWGGMWGHWDCSAFVRDVFGVFGFVLPRNSTSQSKVGTVLGEFDGDTDIDEKCAVLDAAPPGATILRLPGHVMIYLGSYDDNYYIIHDIWAYRTKDLGRRYLVEIGRVAVSDLTLGKGGARGSLIQRITHVVLMKTPEGATDADAGRLPVSVAPRAAGLLY